jgi:hypothetical protein
MGLERKAVDHGDDLGNPLGVLVESLHRLDACNNPLLPFVYRRGAET